MIHAASKFHGALPICRYLCADSNVRGIADSFSQLGMKSARFGPYVALPTLSNPNHVSHKEQCKKLLEVVITPMALSINFIGS